MSAQAHHYNELTHLKCYTSEYFLNFRLHIMLLMRLQSSRPLTCFVFAFRGQGIRFRVKYTHTWSSGYSQKQDKHINDLGANVSCKYCSCPAV